MAVPLLVQLDYDAKSQSLVGLGIQPGPNGGIIRTLVSLSVDKQRYVKLMGFEEGVQRISCSTFSTTVGPLLENLTATSWKTELFRRWMKAAVLCIG